MPLCSLLQPFPTRARCSLVSGGGCGGTQRCTVPCVRSQVVSREESLPAFLTGEDDTLLEVSASYGSGPDMSSSSSRGRSSRRGSHVPRESVSPVPPSRGFGTSESKLRISDLVQFCAQTAGGYRGAQVDTAAASRHAPLKGGYDTFQVRFLREGCLFFLVSGCVALPVISVAVVVVVMLVVIVVYCCARDRGMLTLQVANTIPLSPRNSPGRASRDDSASDTSDTDMSTASTTAVQGPDTLKSRKHKALQRVRRASACVACATSGPAVG